MERERGYGLPGTYTLVERGAMIGAKRVAVTRALKRLQEEEAVELRRLRIRVEDLQTLRRVAQRDR